MLVAFSWDELELVLYFSIPDDVRFELLLDLVSWDFQEILAKSSSAYITLGNKKIFLSLGSDCWNIFGYIGVAKSENALSSAELARVFEVTSLAKTAKLRKYLHFLQ